MADMAVSHSYLYAPEPPSGVLHPSRLLCIVGTREFMVLMKETRASSSKPMFFARISECMFLFRVIFYLDVRMIIGSLRPSPPVSACSGGPQGGKHCIGRGRDNKAIMVPCSEGHEHVNFVTPEIVPVGMVSRPRRYDRVRTNV